MDRENSRSNHVVRAEGGQSLLTKILIVILIIVSLCGILWFGGRALSTVTADSNVKTKQFQAVFLTNGQVYFGKLSKVNNGYVKLTNIYYLQVSSSGSQSTVQPSNSSTAQQQVSLAKLGGELHGPEDSMFINRDQMLFWENLKSDGKVVQAISNYQSTKK